MADGGFVIKFDGKEAERCFACSFDYDVYEYSINGGEPKPLPEGIGTIEIEVE